MFKKFIGGIMDNFKAADFDIKGNMKVKSLQTKFKENFGLTLRIYKGKHFADADATLASLKNATATGADIVIKATMKNKDVIQLFVTSFGLTVNIADATNEHLVPKELTIGQASRGEYDKNAAWYEKTAKQDPSKPKPEKQNESAVSKPPSDKKSVPVADKPQTNGTNKTGGNMAELSVSGKMLVGTFKKKFKEEYGVGVRVYKGKQFADDTATLASVRTEAAPKGGDVKINARMLVGNLEKKFKEEIGITIQVEDKAGKLADDALSLAAVSRG